jgi:hypothetical protein
MLSWKESPLTTRYRRLNIRCVENWISRGFVGYKNGRMKGLCSELKNIFYPKLYHLTHTVGMGALDVR